MCDLDKLLTFYDFPAEHWPHIRSTNAIESSFATVRLRTRVKKGAGSRTKALLVAFQRLGDAGGSPDPVELAGGISTALVTTFWGLVVAIPALAAYALIRNKLDALAAEALLAAEGLLRPFKPSSRKSGSSTTAAAEGEA